MKRLLSMFAVALFVAAGSPGHAEARHRHHSPAASTRKAQRQQHLHKHRARRPTRVAPGLAATDDDELVLSPAQLKQLQRNLIAAGYLDGTVDGRLTHRTRKALADFQRDYHMVGTGRLDRATAAALLGSNEIGSPAIATASKPNGPK